MPNTNTKLVDSKTIAALFELTPRRIQQQPAAERGAVVLLAYFDSIHILCRLYRHGQASCQHEGRYDK